MGSVDPRILRLQQLQDGFSQYPGRVAGGTGLTGLNSNDAQGYSNMLNEQVEFENLNNELEGKGPLRVRRGRSLGSASLQGLKSAADYDHASRALQSTRYDNGL